MKFIWNLLKQQDYKCSISGMYTSYKDNTASTDRIGNNKGYTEDNVHITHKDINCTRNKFDLEYFINICKLISNNNEQ